MIPPPPWFPREEGRQHTNTVNFNRRRRDSPPRPPRFRREEEGRLTPSISTTEGGTAVQLVLTPGGGYGRLLSLDFDNRAVPSFTPNTFDFDYMRRVRPFLRPLAFDERGYGPPPPVHVDFDTHQNGGTALLHPPSARFRRQEGGYLHRLCPPSHQTTPGRHPRHPRPFLSSQDSLSLHMWLLQPSSLHHSLHDFCMCDDTYY